MREVAKPVPVQHPRQENDGVQDKWISAVLQGWSTVGHAALSARGLALVVGSPASAIYHHFVDLEHLYEAALDRALGAARQWCAERLDQLDDAPGGHDALAGLLATLIDDWCEGQRDLACAWRECQRLAARNPRYAAPAAQWRALWADFWRGVCDRLDLPEDATLTARFFDGESFLHMLRWRRSTDRAALDETCRGWVCWLRGTLVPAAPWREAAHDAASQRGVAPKTRDTTGDRIATVAAVALARDGAAGVTHRAVAAEAGLTLGVVSHRFKTRAALLEAAFDTAYRLAVPLSDSEFGTFRTDRDAMLARFGSIAGLDAFRLVVVEVMMATMRDPALAPFAAQLRYLRGRTSGRFLRTLWDADRPVNILDAAILSSFTIGQGNHFAGLPEAERQERSAAERAMLLTRLQAG